MYSLTESDGLCFDIRAEAVNDLSDCHSAVVELKKISPNVIFREDETQADWPPGCYVVKNYVYFNKNSFGARHPVASQVCRTNETGTTDFGICFFITSVSNIM